MNGLLRHLEKIDDEGKLCEGSAKFLEACVRVWTSFSYVSQRELYTSLDFSQILQQDSSHTHGY